MVLVEDDMPPAPPLGSPRAGNTAVVYCEANFGASDGKAGHQKRNVISPAQFFLIALQVYE